MLKPLDRNKVHAFYSFRSKYRGYVNRGVAWTHRFGVLPEVIFSLFNNSSNQKSHNDDEGLAFFDSMDYWIKRTNKHIYIKIIDLLHKMTSWSNRCPWDMRLRSGAPHQWRTRAMRWSVRGRHYSLFFSLASKRWTRTEALVRNNSH